MKVFLVFLVLGAFSVSAGKSKGSSASQNGYSQPISPNYPAPPPPSPARHDTMHYSYSQPMVSASTQTEYYQPADQAFAASAAANPTYGNGVYRQQPVGAAGYYEPVPQGSAHHHHHPIKRGHGIGWGHGESNLAFLIPLIIIPLLLCWPFFIHAASHHHHPVVYASPGWKRSSDGKAPTVKEKTDELTEKILPKLKDQ